VAKLYPQAHGCLFFAFYDSQNYGGGILISPTQESVNTGFSRNFVHGMSMRRNSSGTSSKEQSRAIDRPCVDCLSFCVSTAVTMKSIFSGM
jgi:hypothetical protein